MSLKREPSQPSAEPGVPNYMPSGIEYSVVNENWRGKNDPTERRRIQNRLNQRAFRERRRAGQLPKRYRPRASSAAASHEQASGDEQDNDDGDDDDDDDDDEDDDSDAETDCSASESDSETKNYRTEAVASARGSSSASRSPPSTQAVDASGRVWDELARIICRNLMTAAIANAQQLDIPPSAIQRATPTYTPRLSNRSVSAGLIPVNLQYTVAHDLIIDTIPHPQFRSNILRGIATRAFDANLLYDTIRHSGALEANRSTGDSWQRSGLVVWGTLPPDQITSWELSEAFIRRWAILLQNCEDLLAVTNAWRARRGENALVLALRSR